ncbi:MAG: bacteriohemerythrin [Desulfuromonadales bacterium]
MEMHTDTYLLDIGKLVVELTMVGGSDNDLDALLARILSVLEKLPQLRLQHAGAIYMFSPRNLPVRVAQHGLNTDWFQESENDPLYGFQAPFRPECVEYATACHRLLLLPLKNGTDPLGQVVLFTDSDWSPTPSELEFQTDISRALSGIISRFLLDEILRLREIELEEARTEAIRRLGAASEYRDNETGMHIMRMTSISVVIAKALGLSDEERELLAITAPMHDVGKIGIADAIMLKPDRLTPAEFDIMKTHATIGGRLLAGSDKLIDTARQIAVSHHENWDGSGYPAGLHGEQIPVLARVCALADVFDALVSARPYKEAWSLQQAIEWIKEQAGLKFDPAVVVAFEAALPEILRIRELYRDDVIDPQQVFHLPDLPFREIRWISWDESLSAGISSIDEHHRYLFDLTNDLIGVVANRLGARELARVLKALGEYAVIHFSAEEKMMQHYHFERLALQREQHELFLKRMHEFHQELHENPLVAQHEILIFLKNWLVAHIRDEDSRLAALVWQNRTDV